MTQKMEASIRYAHKWILLQLREQHEQLNRDIVESGQSVNKDLDKFGSAPSGVALKFMYSSLDLKCNLMETESAGGFELLLYFVDLYLQISGHGDYEKIDVELVFNRIWR